MASSSKENQSAVANSAAAINVARPIRSGRPRSLSTPHKIFTYDPRSLDSDAVSPLILAESSNDRPRETVADALSHLIPTMTPGVATTEQTIATFDFEEVAGPRGSPLTPVASPQVTFVEEDATAGAEASPVKQNRVQQHSAIGLKRKANDAIPVTPPRRLRQKTNAVAITAASNGGAPASDLMAKLGQNVRTWPDSVDSDLNHYSLAHSFTLDPFANGSKLAEPDKAQAKNSINKVLAVTSKILQSQRALIHKYKTFDMNTYNPMGRLDKGTEQLRDFTSRLRCDLEDMERYMGELADL